MSTSTPYAPTSTRSPRRRPVRLTRRGRMLRSLVLAVVVLTAVLAAAVVWGPSVVATSGTGEPVPVRTVTVQPGQTLWDIANDSGIGGDPRDVVEQIEQLNGLSDAGALQVGDQLAVPLD